MSRTIRSNACKEITGALLRSWPLPEPEEGADKEGRGSVLVIAGAPQMPGPALLAGTAALRVGAGKLQVATCESVAALVAVALPEALVVAMPHSARGGMTAAGGRLLAEKAARARAVLIGPGMQGERAVSALLDALLPQLSHGVLVLDAEALKCLATEPKRLALMKGRFVVTPHAGEMAQMRGTSKSAIQKNPQETARAFAAETGAVTVLKGAETFIAGPDGAIYRNTAGTVGLATSGSGDTLAGMIAGLAARGAPALQAAVWGVALHARAGERLARKYGPLGFLARELPAELPSLMRGLRRR